MAERTKRPVKEPQATTGEQLERFAAFNGNAMEVFTEATQAYAKGLATLNAEMMSFFNTRLQHDADLGRALAECKDWTEAVELQQDWALKASEEYLSEASKLMEAASSVARESWQPVYQKANKALAELQKSSL